MRHARPRPVSPVLLPVADHAAHNGRMAAIGAVRSAAVGVRPREAVYRALKQAILLNVLEPSQPLTELGVAQDMGCSQGTVREALLRLQEDGLVLRAGHRGTSVTPLDVAAAEEMLLLRRQIETRAARRAAPRIDADIMAQLAFYQAQMDADAAADDEMSLIEHDMHFHMTLFRVAGFQALEQILQRVMLHTHRQKLWEPRHRRPLAETAARHQQIIAAIPKGGDALAQALAQHIDTIVDVQPEHVSA